MPITANFDEAKQSQLPMVEMLVNMGYHYISSKEIMTQRKNSKSSFILREIASEYFDKINSFEYGGETRQFSSSNIERAIDELENIPLEGLIDTSKTVYNMLRSKSSRTFKEDVRHKIESFDFRFIDLSEPKNNHFAVTTEFVAEGRGNIRCDIVLFVNGIPMVVVENKKSAVDHIQGINQLLKYQDAEHCPKFFVYPQLLISTNKTNFEYGTIKTPAKFFAKWKEKNVSDEALETEVQNVIQKPIENDLYQSILNDLNGSTFGHTQLLNRLSSEQDRGAWCMLRQERLLDLIQNHILYDGGIKKISRYQQYFAIASMLERISTFEPDTKARKGGIIWHTQGSGKSLTMVLFVKALIESTQIINPRIIVVTDRRDLDDQIKAVFKSCNLKKRVTQASSGKHLIELIKKKELDVVTTLVQKFESAKNSGANFTDPDQNIFVLIDEAHRTQGGMANLEMNRIISNACFIGFTGTPLMKKEKTVNKFGSYINTYTIDDALADGVVLPLIYEGRYVPLTQDKEQIDRQVERINLNSEQKQKLQREIKTKFIISNPKRIEEIAFDIQTHFVKNFKETGLKAQIVAPSKYAAVLFKHYFDLHGKISSALVVSDEIGDIENPEDNKKEVLDFLKSIKDNHISLAKYEDEVTNSFINNPYGIEILIVVDKLLTGFDAPRNTVLYLAKSLKDHNLLQAIARVNRLFENNQHPKTSGFIIDYSENAQNLKSALDLFSNFDKNEIGTFLIDIKEKIDELETAYSDIQDTLKNVKNKDDDEAYLLAFTQEDERKIFYDSINQFIKVFGECLALRGFDKHFSHVDMYKRDLKKLLNIRKSMNFKFADTNDFEQYKITLRKILDENIKAEEVEILTKEIDIHNQESFEQAIKELGSDKSKAEARAAQIQKSISEKIQTDPEYYDKISNKVADLLKQMQEKKLSDLEALNQMKIFGQEIQTKKNDDVPTNISDQPNVSIIYRNILPILESKSPQTEQNIKYATEISQLIKAYTSVDWHKNLEKKRQLKNSIDDYVWDEIKINDRVDLDSSKMANLVEKVLDLAINNPNIW